ncbi:MAG: acyl-CoA dehydrogenase family protein, partial [Acidimicrobiia bacterium]|nr:acyl-CoA dehydrogenase family protein [Acidimicrobiia bacterium]
AEWGFLANQYPPVLQTHDRFGHRVDQIEFHPAWHSLMDLSVAAGLHSLAYEAPVGGHTARAALTFLAGQIEQGHGCPISMTSSVLASLRHAPDIAAEWEPRILSRMYDPRYLPAAEKNGVLTGMALTEKQGGSDVRANTSVAEPADGAYLITGHKWFVSAPVCDAFLVLAQAPGGLSCFILPRFRPDGSVNEFRIQRLKDKLGNRSNASSEVEFEGAWAQLVGEEGRGVRTIVEMINGTRLDCTIWSAAIMRQAVTNAAHHLTHRSAFGDLLIDKPLMRGVIADLEVETQSATLLMMRMAGAFDRAPGDPDEAILKRIMTPIAKYWVTKRCTAVVQEALECLGGNGYVEESIMPRLFRESPLNAIWEGSGNVIALDLLRALSREPGARDALFSILDPTRGSDPRLDHAIDSLDRMITGIRDPDREARRLIERAALVIQGALAVQHGSKQLADVFCATRLDGDWGHLFGTIPGDLAVDDLVSDARPV